MFGPLLETFSAFHLGVRSFQFKTPLSMMKMFSNLKLNKNKVLLLFLLCFYVYSHDLEENIAGVLLNATVKRLPRPAFGDAKILLSRLNSLFWCFEM